MGYKIKEVREQMGMTQEELASKSGVSRTTIWALENGIQKNTSTKTLTRIAEAMKTSVDAIFFSDTV